MASYRDLFWLVALLGVVVFPSVGASGPPSAPSPEVAHDDGREVSFDSSLPQGVALGLMRRRWLQSTGATQFSYTIGTSGTTCSQLGLADLTSIAQCSYVMAQSSSTQEAPDTNNWHWMPPGCFRYDACSVGPNHCFYWNTASNGSPASRRSPVCLLLPPPPPSPPLPPSPPPSPPSFPGTSAMADLSAALSALATIVDTHSATLNTHSAMLSCDNAGRRMAEEGERTEMQQLPSAHAIVADYFERHPDAAAPMDNEQLAHMRAHMERLLEHFGQPAVA